MDTRLTRLMKLDVPDDYVALLITALEHHYAYTRAVLRDDVRYQRVAEWFKRQPTPLPEKPVRTGESQPGREPEFPQAPASSLTEAACPTKCRSNLRGGSRISREALVCPNQKIPQGRSNKRL